jgi:tripartite-type tricarboxylate transporter receptor subunit TctC
MKQTPRWLLRLASLVLAVAAPPAASIGWGQTYPSRPITIIVPFAAGGPTDTITRIIAEGMRPSLGQTIIIENQTGAAGSIGVGRAARAPADGYTISSGNFSSHVLNGATYALQYDLLNDLAPVAQVATNPQFIITNNGVPAKNLKDLIAWLKANPNRATAGTAGAGAVSHVAGIFFQKETGTSFQFVPYRGTAPALSDLIAGHIDLMFDQVVESLPQVRAGQIRAYAVTAKTRLESAPDIPTVDEAGVPGLYMSVWTALWVPKGTPKDVIAKLNAAVVKGLADPAVRRRLAELGQDIPPRDQQTPEALDKLQRADADKWWPIIKAAGITGE